MAHVAALQRRLPLQPLLDVARARAVQFPAGRQTSAWQAAVRRARRDGNSLPLSAADRLATKVLGCHPCEVWGEAWWEAS